MWSPRSLFPLLLGAVAVACSQAACGGGGKAGGGNAPGQVASSSPLDGAVNIATDAAIRVTFSQAAAPQSLSGSVSPAVKFVTSWLPDNTTLVLTPDGTLASDTTYTLTIDALTFADGSTLSAPYVIRFTTLGDIEPVTDKWDLWSSGTTRLRGADMHPCRITDTRTDTCIELVSAWDVHDLRNLSANLINASYPGLFSEQPPYNVDHVARAYLDDLVAWAEDAGIYVVIHMRTGPGRNEAAITEPDSPDALWKVWTDTAAHNAWIDMWRYIAQRYGTSPVVVGYDLMVQPHANRWLDPAGQLAPAAFAVQYTGTLGDWNLFARQMTSAIREVDKTTPIIVESLQWASPSWFAALQPTGDDRTVYGFHAYDPGIYTFQPDTAPVRYPSPVQGINFNRDWVVNNLRPVVSFARQHNVPIYVGEFGLLRWVPDAITFISDEIALFEQYGWNYACYVWRSDETDFDGFNIEYGADRNNHTAIPYNPLMNAFTANWPSNTDWPATD